jgi:polyisoprenoid-binding protein YceI
MPKVRTTPLSGLATALLLLCFSVGSATAASYRIDPAHASIHWKVQHLGFSTMVGRFNRFSGTFTYDSESTDVTPAVAIEIEMDSLDSNHSLRDKHLRADFFETGKYPTATFKSTSFKGNADEGELKGMLTMHGVSKEVAVTVRKVGEGKDPWGAYRAGFAATATIDRRDFGIDRYVGPSSWLVDLEIFLEGIRQ